jgi:MFS family permease
VKRALGRTFSSLKVRNFRLFFIGQTVSNTGNWLTTVALTLLVLHLTGSGVAVGLLTACQFGPIMFFSIWAGSIADRSNKRNLLFVTQSLEMAQSVVLAVLAFTPNPPVAVLYVVAAAGGTLLAFDNPLRRSFVTEMVPAGEVPNAVALYSAIVNTSRVFGPALAGLLVVTVGFGWCFTVDAISYVFVLAALWLMRPRELRRIPSRPRQRGEIRAAFRYLRSQPHLRISFTLLAIIGILGYNFNVTLPLFIEHGLQLGDGAYTAAYAVFSAGALVSALVVASRHLVRMRNVLFGAVAFGVTTLALSIAPDLAATIAIVFAVGMASILYMTASTALVQVEAVQEMHGRLLGLQTVLFIGTAPISGPFLGWLSDALGARAPLVLGGVASLLAAGWGILALRRVERRDATDAEALGAAHR